jgi:hypothetical protein
MASTSGLSTFNLDFNDIVEEAYERAGLEVRTGYEFRTARRSFNMLTIEWANRGINLWTIEQGQFVMNTGQGVYALPSTTIDLLDQVIRTQATTPNQIDINISRISESTYSTLPNKLAQGRPIQVWINRQSNQSYLSDATVATAILSTDTTITLSSTVNLPATGFITIDAETIYYSNVSGNQLLNCYRGQYNGVTNTTAAAHAVSAAVTVNNLTSVNVWPTPNAPGDQYVFVYWRMRRMQDAGNGVNVQDIPFRLIPCVVAGLAYYVGSKRPDVPMERIVMLKAAYEEQWTLASQEDREKAPDRYVPRQSFYR